MADTVPGYPIPAGADESIFPYHSAAAVVYWAEKAGMSMVRAIVDQIRDWMGHPEMVDQLARSWGTTAKGNVLDAQQGLTSMQMDLKAYWQGAAFDSFSGYVDSVSKIIDTVAGVMDSMGKLMGDLRKTMTETYSAGIGFIGKCARAVIDGANTLAQDWKNLWGAVCEAILTALGGFVDAITKLAQDALAQMTAYSNTANEISSKAVEIKVPDPMPNSAGVDGNWKVKPAT